MNSSGAIRRRTPARWTKSRIPTRVPGTNNWWTQDGYGGGGFGSRVYGGGSYSNCSDPSQPGVEPDPELPARR